MKLITAIVQDEDAGKVVNALVAKGFGATRFQSHGGFLRARNSTIFAGVEDHRLDEALQVIRDNCRSRTRPFVPPPHAAELGEVFMPRSIDTQVGGATVFVMDVEHYEKM